MPLNWVKVFEKDWVDILRFRGASAEKIITRRLMPAAILAA